MAVKECFILMLIVTFLFLFGYPSWRKYSAGGIITARKMVKVDKFEAPAVTICPQDKRTKQGWKRAKGNPPHNFLEILCNTSDNISYSSLTECIEKKSYKHDEVFHYVFYAIERLKIDLLSNHTDWKANIGFFPFGKCFTFNSSVLIGSNKKNAFKGSLRTRRNQVFLHDPQFFIPTNNPNTVPRILLDVNDQDGSTSIFIKVTKHKKVNN